MKKNIHSLFWSRIGQAVFYFFLGILFAFLFTKTVFSPSESVRENVPVNISTESRG